MVTGARGHREGNDCKGIGWNFPGWGEKFYILIVVVVKTNQTVHLERVNVVACELYLDKPDFSSLKEPTIELATK